jgi:hypothetical protein
MRIHYFLIVTSFEIISSSGYHYIVSSLSSLYGLHAYKLTNIDQSTAIVAKLQIMQSQPDDVMPKLVTIIK